MGRTRTDAFFGWLRVVVTGATRAGRVVRGISALVSWMKAGGGGMGLPDELCNAVSVFPGSEELPAVCLGCVLY